MQYKGIQNTDAIRPPVVRLGLPTRRQLRTFSTILLCLFSSGKAFAQSPNNSNLVVEDRAADLTPPPSRWLKELYLEPKTIRPSSKTLKTRIEAEKRKPEIAEPIVLRLKTTELRPLLAQLASDTAFRKLTLSQKYNFSVMKNLEARIEKKASDAQDSPSRKPAVALLTLNASDLSWIDLDKLSHALAYPSLEPFLPVEEIRALKKDDPAVKERWMSHFGARFAEVRGKAEQWFENNTSMLQVPISALLPEHMKNLLGRYSPFRGRNCFATALQFADPSIIQAKNVNMIREAGHSLALINHDEFSHALWLAYDELTPQQVGQGLQFGDIIAIIDGDDRSAYTSFKHAAVHIAADLYLHKPSKSASSPIEFARWKELVQTWHPLVKQFEVRYFRHRAGARIQEQSPAFAIEKLKWNR
ncbi:hypothetical protein EBR21_13110 [bacterium]|nr:hypothetical protein [bacterium]